MELSTTDGNRNPLEKSSHYACLNILNEGGEAL